MSDSIIRKSRVFLICLVALCLVPVLGAQTVRINIATIAPEKSPYGDVLRKMVAEWNTISGGRVLLKPFYGNALGDEEAIVQNMRSNSLQGAMLTLSGLGYIDKTLMTIATPLLIQDDDQLKYVLTQLTPEINDRLASKGFVGIAYSRAGWLNFFAKAPFHTPSDVKKFKLGISNKSKEIYQAFQTMNYQVVNVDITETLANLLTGRAEALFTSPLVAGSYNWVGSARYMLDLNISPFIGGVIINDKTWSRVPEDLRPKLIQSAQDLASSMLDSALDKLTDQAIQVMTNTKGGLIVVKATPEDRAVWKAELDNALQYTLGTAFDKDMYAKIKSILQNYKK